MSAECRRLKEARLSQGPLKNGEPPLRERQWGTVGEGDIEGGGRTFFLHDYARSRAYRWNKGSLTGTSDGKSDGFLTSERALEMGKMAGFEKAGGR